MNHRHRKVLHTLFDHPISSNITYREIETLLRQLRAEVDNRSGSRMGVTMNGHTVAFHHGQHSLHKEEVARIRHFLTDCGVKPEQFPV